MELDPKYKKENWDIPEGYFDQFEDKVLSRLKSEARPVIPFYRKRVFQFSAIAATLLLFIGISLFRQDSGDQVNSGITFNDLDSAELVAFEENVELSDEEFEELIPAETVDSLYKASIEQSPPVSEFTDAEIEEIEEEFSPLDEI